MIAVLMIKSGAENLLDIVFIFTKTICVEKGRLGWDPRGLRKAWSRTSGNYGIA